jgi:hypothetical protein
MMVFGGVTPCRLTFNNVAEEYAVHIFIFTTLTILVSDTPATPGKIYQTTRRHIKEDFYIHCREVSVLKFKFLVQN